MEQKIVTQEMKNKILEIFEAQDKIIEEQSAYIEELHNEMRLAEKVCRAASNYVRNCGSPVATGWDNMLTALKKWREEDLQKGKWVESLEYQYVCSECGEQVHIDSWNCAILSNYCPNCGIRMAENKDDENN